MADVTVSIVVSLPATLTVGQTAKAVARIVTDVDDSTLDSKSVVWASTAPTVASVDSAGLVKGLASGATTIRATIGLISGSAPLSVSAPVILVNDVVAEAALKLVPIGQTVILRFPTTDFTTQVTG